MMGKSTFQVIVLLLALHPLSITAGKVLLIPFMHSSHVGFFSDGGKALVDAGHEVWLLSVESFRSKVEGAGIKFLPYVVSEPGQVEKHINEVSKDALSSGNPLRALFILWSTLATTSNAFLNDVMSNEELITSIERHKFDLVIIDSFPFARGFLTIPYRFDIPYIMMGPFQDPWVAGVSALPSMEPHVFIPAHGRLNFFQRLLNTIVLTLQRQFLDNLAVGNDFIAKYAPNKPPTTITKLLEGAQMWFITSEIICTDFGRVSAPHYRFIGSLSGAKVTKPLAQDLEKFVQSAPDGIIVVSFGSLMKALGEQLIPVVNKLLEAFKQRPNFNVVLQFKTDFLDEIPNNVRVLEWLPQGDLMAHPKTRLFVTHGGLNGQLEAVYHGLPTITLPFQGEQRSNGLRAEKKGFGKLLDTHAMTPDDIVEAIDELTGNPEYKKNVKQCSEILKTMPSPQSTLVFWVEHVITFGGSHLRPPGMDLPWYQFFLLDVLLFFVVTFNVSLLMCYCCCKCTIRRCRGKPKSKTE